MLTVDYELTEDDLVAVTRYKLSTPQARRTLRSGALITFVIWSGLLVYAVHRHSLPLTIGASAALIFNVVTTAFRYAGYSWYAETIGKRLAKRINQAGVFGRHTVTLTAEGVREVTDVNDRFDTWRGVHAVEASASNVFFLLSELFVHAIPRRAFFAPANADAFEADARRCWTASRSSAS